MLAGYHSGLYPKDCIDSGMFSTTPVKADNPRFGVGKDSRQIGLQFHPCRLGSETLRLLQRWGGVGVKIDDLAIYSHTPHWNRFARRINKAPLNDLSTLTKRRER